MRSAAGLDEAFQAKFSDQAFFFFIPARTALCHNVAACEWKQVIFLQLSKWLD